MKEGVVDEEANGQSIRPLDLARRRQEERHKRSNGLKDDEDDVHLRVDGAGG